MARFGYPDEAIAALTEAIAAGYRNHEVLSTDPNLETLRQREDFQKILKDLDAKQKP
jgi:hypothetical protein